MGGSCIWQQDVGLIRRERLEAESSQEAAWTRAVAEVGPAREGEERDACEKEPVITDS